MPRKKPPRVLYSVFVDSYADEALRARVERGEEFITQPEQLTTELVYMGTSERQAGYAFYKAIRAAMTQPLVFAVVMWRGQEVIARVRIERR